MAFSVVGTATFADSTASTTRTVTVPAGVQNGDGLFLFASYAGGTTTISSVTGLTLTEVGSRATQSGHSSYLFKRVNMASSEAGTVLTITTSTSIKSAGGLIVMRGVNATDFVDAFQNTTSSGSTVAVPSVVTTVSGCIELSFVAGSRGANNQPVSDWTPPSGTTRNFQANNPFAASGSGLTGIAGGHDPTVKASGATIGNHSWTADQTSTNSSWTVSVKTDGVVTPTLTRQLVGVYDSSSIVVVSKTENVASGIRLAVSTASNMSSPTYGTLVAPATGGYTRNTVTGLSADTAYYYALELDGVLSTTAGPVRTLPTLGAQASFGFAAASCSLTGSNNVVFDSIRTRVGANGRTAQFFAHLGDVHYQWAGGGVAPNDEAQITAAYEQSLNTARQSALYAAIPVSHTWSDNDFGGSNSDSTTPGRAAAIAARRKLMPDPILPDSEGIWRSWVVGRVRCIQTDSRSYMSDRTAADNSSKTMLGTAQKQWLKDQFITAVQRGEVVVWLHDNAWGGAAVAPGNVEEWRAYNTERTEIGNYITANAVRLVYIHGDLHRLSADDGSGNSWGGFPMIGAAPLDQTADPAGAEAASEGFYPASSGSQNQYGWFDVTDSGDTLTVAYTGYTADGTARVSYSTSFPMSNVSVWDGSAEHVAESVAVWNGSSEQTASDVEVTS